MACGLAFGGADRRGRFCCPVDADFFRVLTGESPVRSTVELLVAGLESTWCWLGAERLRLAGAGDGVESASNGIGAGDSAVGGAALFACCVRGGVFTGVPVGTSVEGGVVFAVSVGVGVDVFFAAGFGEKKDAIETCLAVAFFASVMVSTPHSVALCVGDI